LVGFALFFVLSRRANQDEVRLRGAAA